MDEQPTPPMLSTPTSFNLIEAAQGVVVRPVPTMRQIATSCPWWLALLVAMGVAVIAGLASLASFNAQLAQALNPATMSQFPPEARPQITAWMNTIVSAAPAFVLGSALVFTPIGLFLGAGLYWLIARMLGGQGAFGGLFATNSFAGSIPSLVQAPLVAVLGLAGPNFSPLISSVSMLASIWILVLQVIAIRESMNLSTGRAIAVVLILIGALILLCCCLAIVGFGLIAAAASSAGGVPRKP